MSWKSFPSWTPALLLRHVALLVEWLRLANAVKRWRSGWTNRSLLLVGACVTVAGAAVTVLSSRLAAFVALLAEYWLLTALVTAVYAASSVARRRRRIHELHLQSWLVAAPIRRVAASQAIRTLLPTLAQLLVAALLIMLVGWVAAEMRAAGVVIAAIAVGMSVGTIAGWGAKGDSAAARLNASRYVPSKSTRSSPVGDVEASTRGMMQRGGRALSGWPIAQVLAWSRPENSRYVLIAALFAVQGGSSAIVGLSVVALYFIGSYLAALLSALLHVARSASAWLRSTPMALNEFVWQVSRRAIAHQVVGTALVAAVMLLLGAPLGATLQVAALWLSLVISVSGCALIDSYRGCSPVVKVAVSFVAWAALAAVLQMRSASRA